MSRRKPTVRRPDEDEDGFVFFGAELYDTSHHTLALIVRRADLEDCVASGLETALVPQDEPGEIYITDDDEEEYHYEESPPLPVSFDIAADCLRTKVAFRVPAWVWDADDGEGGSSTALEVLTPDEGDSRRHSRRPLIAPIGPLPAPWGSNLTRATFGLGSRSGPCDR